ncbi:hypothetical protein HGRIS_002571 [Hohenbuehelia grisea]|uniref:ATP-dependent RNA helicase n=1 Tax=Hohenbuehelia grisea TaxID=104357 RepID=A0ABR3JM97_9AGAR
MDDDLILNVADSDQTRSTKSSGNKGGRWTDRVKAKRATKRKVRPTSNEEESPRTDEARPIKRPRKEHPAAHHPSSSSSASATTRRPQTQIISSLFSSNPKVEEPASSAKPKAPSAPSNAPLKDSSSFAGLGLDPLITAHLLSKMNIANPTSIQKATLPVFLAPPSEDYAGRDVFIQSQTGSGKTLSFLLPILQDLLPLSSLSYIDRSIGTLAIIIAPTRELAQQISDVLEALIRLRLRPEDESADESSTRLTRWLVSGLLTGGATRTHEKARLRKGVPILVSTPGRLLDHLQNTSSFNVAKCRWLVLDEADRLMELGFEETISGIIQGLDGRRRLALKALEEGKSSEVGGWDWSRERRTVLCSATIREDVQKLAGKALTRPLMVKATEADTPADSSESLALGLLPTGEKFTPPSQLSQRYVIAPLKLRLVALVALLRSLVAKSNGRKSTKIIVFFSCTDSVDYFWNLVGGASMNEDPEDQESTDEDSEDDDETEDVEKGGVKDAASVSTKSALLPGASIFRLHGSLATPVRQAALRGFSSMPNQETTTSILFCTSVASRGLDLPLVRAVVQFDLPTEGGATEYVHRVGRTARAGKGGEAWSLVAPSEAAWVPMVEAQMQGAEKQKIALDSIRLDDVLKDGFGGSGREFEERATEVQLTFERWVLRRKDSAALARKAFLSHMRAYATHPSAEKHIFHIRHLHIGHLAKSFALRDAPTSITGGSKKAPSKPAKSASRDKQGAPKAKPEIVYSKDAEKRMNDIVRAQGRLSKHKGLMVSSGTSEFQIAGADTLAKLLRA